jgi:hemolysin III
MERKTAPAETFADGCIHIAGVTAGLIAATLLLSSAIPTLPGHATGSLAIYAAGMMLMFGCSAVYHMSPWPTWKPLLRRVDQAAIFVKIAATYTPFLAVKMNSWWGLALLALIWAAALSGAAAKLILTDRWDGVSLMLYLGLGWLSVITLVPLSSTVPLSALIMLAIGGVLYTLGVIFHVWESLPFQNAIWHVFVLAATACHFSAVAIATFN